MLDVSSSGSKPQVEGTPAFQSQKLRSFSDLQKNIKQLKESYPPSTGPFGVKLQELEETVQQRLEEEGQKAQGSGGSSKRTEIFDNVVQIFFEEVEKELVDCQGDPAKLDRLIRDVKGCSFHEVIDRIQQIGAGKTKEIVVRSLFAHHVYSVAKGSSGPLGTISELYHTRELKEEFKTVKDIRNSYSEKSADSEDNDAQRATANLSLDFEEVAADKSIQGKYTLRSARAAGDLERKLGAPTLEVVRDPTEYNADLLSYGEQILSGFADLHKAGYIHGDPKLENCFFYPNETEGRQVKIADFGKAQKLGPDESGLYAGNPRHMAPERAASQAAEVFAAGEMLVRVLESHYLTANQPMLIEPSVAKSSEPKPERVGFERYLSKSAKCPQRESVGLRGRVSMIVQKWRRAIVDKVSPKATETRTSDVEFRKEVTRYVDALVNTMGNNEPPPDMEALSNLRELLLSMLDPSQDKRPTMERAVQEFHSIRENLFPQGTSLS